MTEPVEAACTAALLRLKEDDGGPPCPSCFAEGFREGWAALRKLHAVIEGEDG